MADAPRVSVVVPVRDRRGLLSALLDALATQTHPDFEVVVVDDGSTDGSGGEAEARAGTGVRIRVVRVDRLGAVAARRAGVAAAQGEILAFTDSDCVPAPDWLARGVAAIDKGADVVNGRTVPARRAAPGERTMASGEEGLYPTCNVFYRRVTYEEAGGFDPDAAGRLGFRGSEEARSLGFGEDTLLAWRARRAGSVAAYAPEAVVTHAVHQPDCRAAVRRAWMAGAFPALVREVPELRGASLLPHGVFLGDAGRLPLYAAIVAFATGRQRLAALASASWAVGRRARLRRRTSGTRLQHARALPMELAVDAVTAGALLAGSACARTLVL